MTRPYPGMLGNSIEYFSHLGEVFKIHQGFTTKFTDTKHPELEQMLQDDALLCNTLTEMCGDDLTAKTMKLASCRFGGLNFEADFSDEKKSIHDHIDCPHRGSCIGENIVCKPIEINGSPLNEKELSVLRCCATNDKNIAIADDLNIPLGTLNVLKTDIYKKYGFVTKQQSTSELFLKGLL